MTVKFYLNMYFIENKFILCLVAEVLDRPVESTNATKTKIRVLQFISRINEGENLG